MKGQILDSSKLKEFADDHFKFDERWWKVLQNSRKHCSLHAISPYPSVFERLLLQTLVQIFRRIHAYLSFHIYLSDI